MGQAPVVESDICYEVVGFRLCSLAETGRLVLEFGWPEKRMADLLGGVHLQERMKRVGHRWMMLVKFEKRADRDEQRDDLVFLREMLLYSVLPNLVGQMTAGRFAVEILVCDLCCPQRQRTCSGKSWPLEGGDIGDLDRAVGSCGDLDMGVSGGPGAILLRGGQDEYCEVSVMISICVSDALRHRSGKAVVLCGIVVNWGVACVIYLE